MATRPYPKNVKPRGLKLSIQVRLPDRSWKWVSTGLDISQGEQAGRLQVATQEKLDKGDLTAIGPVSVTDFARRWLRQREDEGNIVTIGDDKSRISNHLYGSALARMEIGRVKPRHVRQWVKDLRAGELAPRSVRNVYAVVATMFKDAVIDDYLAATPCVLRRGDLPPIVDADPEWRADAIYTRGELEQIISDERTPHDRRIYYALCFLTGCRSGEVAALRWRHWDPSAKPLGRLLVSTSYSIRRKKEKSTKTTAVRRVPVHPVLAKLLAEWKLGGYEATFGYKPADDELIVPSTLRERKNRHVGAVKLTFNSDLGVLGLRVRRIHDARRTFRSLLEDDGGTTAAIDWIVYGRPQTNSGRYHEPAWDWLCKPVQSLAIELRKSDVRTFRAVSRGGRPRKH